MEGCFCGSGFPHPSHDKEIKIREERDRLLLQKIHELVEAAGPVLEELMKANPYDRRDVRFPSKAEVTFRKAVWNAEKRKCDEAHIWVNGFKPHHGPGSICQKCETPWFAE